jgi:hypothetical protein
VRISSWPGCNRSSLARGRIHLSRLSSSDRPRNLQRRGRPYISADDVLQHLAIQRQVRHDLLQLRALVLKLLQPLHFRRHQPTELLAPDVIGRFANPRLPANLSDRRCSSACRSTKAICCSLHRDVFMENPPPDQDGKLEFSSFPRSSLSGAGQEADHNVEEAS